MFLLSFGMTAQLIYLPCSDTKRPYFNFSCLFLFKIDMGPSAFFGGPKKRGRGGISMFYYFSWSFEEDGAALEGNSPLPPLWLPFPYTGSTRQCGHKGENMIRSRNHPGLREVYWWCLGGCRGGQLRESWVDKAGQGGNTLYQQKCILQT